jgi:hypothetical protein
VPDGFSLPADGAWAPYIPFQPAVPGGDFPYPPASVSTERRLFFLVEEFKMIKGLAITPPVLGRVSIGRVVEKDGKRLPAKDDQFTITTQVQTKDGWVLHPLDEQLRAATAGQKLRTIPVRLLFNEPDLNLRADYSLFDRQSGRLQCSGNGETCRRRTNQGIESMACPAPDACELAASGCKPYARLNVLIGEDEPDLGTFIFRTTGFNSIRTLTARMLYYKAVSGDLLACLPLALRLKAKSTTLSRRTPIYYVDLTLRDGQSLESAIAVAGELAQRRKSSGIDQASLDEAGRQGFANGAIEDGEEEIPEVVEEFFPVEGDGVEVTCRPFSGPVET